MYNIGLMYLLTVLPFIVLYAYVIKKNFERVNGRIAIYIENSDSDQSDSGSESDTETYNRTNSNQTDSEQSDSDVDSNSNSDSEICGDDVDIQPYPFQTQFNMELYEKSKDIHIKQLNKKINNITQKLETEKDNLYYASIAKDQDYDIEINKLKEKINELTADIYDKKYMLDVFKDEVDLHQSLVDDLESENEVKQCILDKLETFTLVQRDQIKKKNKKITEMSDVHELTLNENNSLKIKCDNLKKNITLITEQLKMYEGNNKELTKELDKRDETIKELLNDLSEPV